MKTILVQMADSKWTKSAISAACDLARESGAEIVLARMLSASFLNWRGMTVDEYMFTDAECEDIYAYEEIARKANVPIRSMIFEYHDLADGLAKAAAAVDADKVIAQMPHETLPIGESLELKYMERLMAARRQQLYTVKQPAAKTAGWKPQVEAAH